MTAEEIIRKLELTPLPEEGGYYRRTWGNNHGTAIYLLLTPELWGFSALHVLDSPETYHFYCGNTVRLTLFWPDAPPEEIRLGNDLASGDVPQYTVLPGTVQGSRLIQGGEWALLGMTMAPGYSPELFQLSKRSAMLRKYPEHSEWITSLTRCE